MQGEKPSDPLRWGMTHTPRPCHDARGIPLSWTNFLWESVIHAGRIEGLWGKSKKTRENTGDAEEPGTSGRFEAESKTGVPSPYVKKRMGIRRSPPEYLKDNHESADNPSIFLRIPQTHRPPNLASAILNLPSSPAGSDSEGGGRLPLTEENVDPSSGKQGGNKDATIPMAGFPGAKPQKTRLFSRGCPRRHLWSPGAPDRFLLLSRIAIIRPPMIGLMAPVGGAFLALEPGVKKRGFLSLFFVVFLP